MEQKCNFLSCEPHRVGDCITGITTWNDSSYDSVHHCSPKTNTKRKYRPKSPHIHWIIEAMERNNFEPLQIKHRTKGNKRTLTYYPIDISNGLYNQHQLNLFNDMIECVEGIDNIKFHTNKIIFHLDRKYWE